MTCGKIFCFNPNLGRGVKFSMGLTPGMKRFMPGVRVTTQCVLSSICTLRTLLEILKVDTTYAKPVALF